MVQLQPNFEKVKIALYKKITNEDLFVFNPLFETIKGNFGLYGNKLKEQKKDLNKQLSNLAIDNIGTYIEFTKENLPKWIINKEFIIDYNKYGMLDLIRINR